MSEEKKYRKIDFVQVLDSLNEETRNEIHSIGDHKLFCGILDAHTVVIDDTMDEKLGTFMKGNWAEFMAYVENQHLGLTNQLTEQTKLINEIKYSIIDHSKRIKCLEKKVSSIVKDVSQLKKEINILKTKRA